MKQAAGRFLAASAIAGWANAIAVAFVATTCVALLPASVHAQPITSDSRIKTFVYNPNEVFSITTHYGYQSNIEFAQKEAIETISVGDRVGWQVVPAGRRLFIRAMEENARTNMTVVTNQRAYQFELRSSSASAVIGSEALTYVVRFFYPSEAGINSNIPPAGMMQPALPSANAFPPSYPGTASLTAAPESVPTMPTPIQAPPTTSATYPNPAPVMSKDVAPPAAPAKAAALAPLPSNTTVADATPSATTLPPSNRPSLSPSLVNDPTALAAATKPQALTPLAITPPKPNAAPVSLEKTPLAASVAPTQGLKSLPAAAPKTTIGQLAASTPAATAQSTALNYRYTFSGSNALAPTKIFDDGKATYFKLPAGSMPQFELLNPAGNAVNLTTRRTPEGLVAVDVVAQNFRLKQAGDEVLVYNEAPKGVN